MAIIEVKVPQLSESVAEATLLAWHKKAGEAVTRDENLVDVETDKVVLEPPAPDSGVLVEIVKGDGSSVTSNLDLIALHRYRSHRGRRCCSGRCCVAVGRGSGPLPVLSLPAGGSCVTGNGRRPHARFWPSQGVNPANVARHRP